MLRVGRVLLLLLSQLRLLLLLSPLLPLLRLPPWLRLLTAAAVATVDVYCCCCHSGCGC